MRPLLGVTLKRGFFLLAFWCLNASAGIVPDASTLQKLCNKNAFAKACLSGLLMFRCGQYHTNLDGLGNCLDTAIDTSNLIDLSPTTKTGGAQAIAFSEELVQLMRDPFTKKFLEKLRDDASEAMQHHAEFDLWKHTLAQLNGDKSKALWFIGVLLQDTSSAVEHVEYLRDRRHDGISIERIDLLEEVMDLFQPEQLEDEKFREWLTLYPAMVPVGSERSFNPTVYHFYTLGYLSLRLKWRNANQKLAAFQPFWIEVAYKFKQISPSRWPLDPRPFKRADHESRLRDIWGNYIATRWAAGMPAPRMTYDSFADGLAADPSGYLKRLYSGFL